MIVDLVVLDRGIDTSTAVGLMFSVDVAIEEVLKRETAAAASRQGDRSGFPPSWGTSAGMSASRSTVNFARRVPRLLVASTK